MKKAIKIMFLAAVAVIALAGCANKLKPLGTVSSKIKKPEMLDHKNLKWDKPVPGWVAEEPNVIEKTSDYKGKDVYLFKFESPRSKSLEGAELWTRDFSVPSEMARMVKVKVESKAAAAAAGDKDKVEGYLEDIVKTVTSTKLSGFKKETDYWIQMRYFDADGNPTGDDYTYIVLYSISKKTLDKLIQNAISGADEDKPKSEEEKAVRQRVKEALSEGL